MSKNFKFVGGPIDGDVIAVEDEHYPYICIQKIDDDWFDMRIPLPEKDPYKEYRYHMEIIQTTYGELKLFIWDGITIHDALKKLITNYEGSKI